MCVLKATHTTLDFRDGSRPFRAKILHRNKLLQIYPPRCRFVLYQKISYHDEGRWWVGTKYLAKRCACPWRRRNGGAKQMRTIRESSTSEKGGGGGGKDRIGPPRREKNSKSIFCHLLREKKLALCAERER